VLLLRVAAGLTAPEVAATLGKTTGAVKALQHRGLARLARVLGVTSDTSAPEPLAGSSKPAPRTSRGEGG
jgi:DNA-directed RNA polymerase specialized sigma24 family protein